jgi:hypothetical protein
MKKIAILFTFLASVTILATGQNLADNYVKGTIYLNDGQVIQANLYFTILNPDDFQKSVSYISDAIYENVKATDKLKSKDIQEVKAKDAKYFELADGRKFISMKYSDMSSAGAGSIPSYYFFEQIVSGKISLYRKYSVSGGIAFDEATKESEREWIKTHYELLIQAADKGPKSISNIALPDYISDNTTVLEKYNNDQYGDLLKVFNKKMKMGEISHPKYEQDFIKILTDYNN